LEIVEKSICGDYRALNEDNTGVFRNQTDQILLLVADGMGGHNYGDVASSMTTEFIKEAWEQENFLRLTEAEKFLRQLVIKTNRKLYDYQNEHQKYKGMGTTLVMAAIVEGIIIVLNVGDSRCYAMNRRSIEQVTRDHSFVNILVDTGEITEEEAFHHPKRNMVTKAMGTERLIQPDIFRLRNKQYDYLLLASDGLTDEVRENEIHSIMLDTKHSLDDRALKLIERAQSNGSTDNISVCVAALKASEAM
jgi:serine/threonine protein phosphatase PrpC